MATNAPEQVVSVRACVVCNVSTPDMRDPRGLPCGHIACRVCLSQMKDSDGVVTCRVCEKTLDGSVEVDDLPVDYGEDCRCDPCYKKGKMSLARLFCKACQKKMCDSHIEV